MQQERSASVFQVVLVFVFASIKTEHHRFCFALPGATTSRIQESGRSSERDSANLDLAWLQPLIRQPLDEGVVPDRQTEAAGGRHESADGPADDQGWAFETRDGRAQVATAAAAAQANGPQVIVIQDDGDDAPYRGRVGSRLGAQEDPVVISSDDEDTAAPDPRAGFFGTGPPPPLPLVPEVAFAGGADGASAPGAAPAGMGDEDSGEAGTSCIVCLDVTSASGPHRLCSLKCGHVFGAHASSAARNHRP